MTTFFITGGCGFLGLWLTRHLVNDGNEVVLYDISINDKLIKDISNRVRMRKGSVASIKEVTEELKRERPKVLVHYAALLSAAAESDPKTGYDVDIASTWPLFDAARTADVEHILFASSIAAYGPGDYDIAREDIYTIPTTVYGVSKVFGELAGMWFYRTYGIQFLAFRYGSIIGPGRRDGGASAYAQLIVQKPAQGEPYTVYVPESSRIPIAYVKDAADATLMAYRKSKSLKDRIFNVASLSPSPSALELATSVRKHVSGAKIDFEPTEKATRIVNSWPKDMTMSRLSQVGWRPAFGNVDSVVADFVAEVKQKPEMFKI